MSLPLCNSPASCGCSSRWSFGPRVCTRTPIGLRGGELVFRLNKAPSSSSCAGSQCGPCAMAPTRSGSRFLASRLLVTIHSASPDCVAPASRIEHPLAWEAGLHPGVSDADGRRFSQCLNTRPIFSRLMPHLRIVPPSCRHSLPYPWQGQSVQQFQRGFVLVNEFRLPLMEGDEQAVRMIRRVDTTTPIWQHSSCPSAGGPLSGGGCNPDGSMR